MRRRSFEDPQNPCSARSSFWSSPAGRVADARALTIVTSQLPVGHWHEALGEPTIADAILDRLVHGAHRLELKGDSRRRAAARAAEGTVSTDAASDMPDSAQSTERR